MASSILTTGAGLLGAAVGAPFGFAGFGFTVGSFIGKSLFSSGSSTRLQDQIVTPRLNDLQVQQSAYGTAIPLIYGRYRVAGNIIEADTIREHESREDVSVTSEQEGGKGMSSQSTTTQTQISYNYTISFAIGLCVGEIQGIGKIWMNKKLWADFNNSGATAGKIYTSQEKAKSIRIYTGSETQEIDDVLSSLNPAGETPAYRGLAYIVFEDLELGDFGNAIPLIEVEVINDGSVVNGKYLGNTDAGVPYFNSLGFQSPYVFTGIDNGVLRYYEMTTATPSLLTNTEKVRLLDVDGNFLGYDSYKNVDNYGSNWEFASSKPWVSVGVWSGYYVYLRAFTNAGANTLTNPLNSSNAPELVILESEPSDYTDAVINAASLAGNIFDILPDQTKAVSIASISEDHKRLLLVTGRNGVFNSWDGWYLYSLSGTTPVLEASGSGTLADTGSYFVTADFGAGAFMFNRAMSSSGIACLENDYQHVWLQNIIDTTRPTWSLRLVDGSAPVITFEEDNVNPNADTASKVTGIADNGLFWVNNDDTIDTFTRNDLLDPSASPSLQTIVEDLCSKSGLDVSEYDASDLSGISVVGYAVGNVMTLRNALQPLMQAYFFDAVISGGVLKFVLRDNASVKSISDDDLAAHTLGEGVPDKLIITQQQELELDRAVTVNYISDTDDYLTGSQVTTRLQTVTKNESVIELPLVLSDDDAKNISSTQLYGQWMVRKKYEFYLTFKYLDLEPGDVVTITSDDISHTIRITEMSIDPRGLLKCNGEREDISVYSAGQSGVPLNSIAQSLPTPATTIYEWLELPMLRPLDNNAGVYIAVCGTSSSWNGAVLQQSSDGQSFTNVKTFATSATMGMCTGTLGDIDAEGFIRDATNTLNIKLLGTGTLSSISDSAFLAGVSNIAVVGNEIIMFQNATLEADGTYTIDYMLRGLFGTEQYISTHTSNERFVLIQQSTLTRLVIDDDNIGTQYYYKMVSNGQIPANVTPFTKTITGVSLKPYSPVLIKGVRDSSNNLTITWVRRTRFNGAWRDSVDAPLNEDSESYEVDIYFGGSVIRTITGLSSATTTYSAAEQTTDGYTPGDPIVLIVYQLSARVGRGFGGSATV